MNNTTYTGLKLLRAEYNSEVVANEDVNAVTLVTFAANILLQTRIDKIADADAANLADYRANFEPFVNKIIDSVEVRFKTHDWSDKLTWDGRTHGDQVAYLAGGVMKHPVDGSWLNATGAGMIQAYGTPGDPNYGNPNYLFGAYAYRITNVYDDVKYKWTSADGQTRLVWLDLTVSPPVWKNDAGTTMVYFDQRISLPTATKATNNTLTTIASCAHNGTNEPVAANYTLTVAIGTASGYKFTYNGVVVDNVAWVNAGVVVVNGGAAGTLTLTLGAGAPVVLPQSDTVAITIQANAAYRHWIRNDNGAVVTNSLWRILPYQLTKLQINKVKTTVDATAIFTGSLHYQIYMDLAAGMAGAGYPAGNYKVADWAYQTLAEIAAGADADPYIEPMTRAGHSGPIMLMTYDYLRGTKAPAIDANLGMHLDILISDNTPVTNTLGAYATFICMKIASF